MFKRKSHSFISAYMEISTIRASAVIGPYFQPIIMAAVKDGVPYFPIDDIFPGSFHPYNVLSVRPGHRDLSSMTKDVVEKYGWKQVAVLYDSQTGTVYIFVTSYVPLKSL